MTGRSSTGDGDRAGAEGEGAGADTRGTGYDVDAAVRGHAGESAPSGASGDPVGDAVRLPTSLVVVLATLVVVAVWRREPPAALLLTPAVGVVAGWRRPPATLLGVALAAVLVVVGSARAESAWRSLAPDRLGPFTGWARVVDDPQPYRAGTRVILEVDGERFETWSYGTSARRRAGAWRGGEWVRVAGTRLPLEAERAGRVAWQHVVGDLDLDWSSDTHGGDPVARASNRVRSTIERAAALLPANDGALFRGLVVGDDRDQPVEMVERFRASGLSHLTAVSGQNIAFVLAAAGPLLTRLRTWPRWAASVGLIAWFATLTRFEPSILRAGMMAGLSATAFALGHDRSAVRMLALAVTILVLVDPLLVWSVGFWLSVGATAGVSAVGPWLAARLAPLGPLALPLGVTLGAQLGVVVPSVAVFGRLPLTSVPANLLAVPVAGAVMLYGLPAGLLAGLLAGWAPAVAGALLWPVRLGTRWVDTVAAIGARLEPAPPWPWVGWCVVAVLVVGVAVLGRPGAGGVRWRGAGGRARNSDQR